MLYSCAITPSAHQLMQHSWQSIKTLIQLPSIEIKLLSKALIARLIPADAVQDDNAALILIEDTEVDVLIKMLTPVPLFKAVPVISVMVDLCRSPHNMQALVARNVVVKLSDIMDSMSEDDQSKAARLIWRMMELKFESSEEVSVIVNDGTLQGL